MKRCLIFFMVPILVGFYVLENVAEVQERSPMAFTVIKNRSQNSFDVLVNGTLVHIPAGKKTDISDNPLILYEGAAYELVPDDAHKPSLWISNKTPRWIIDTCDDSDGCDTCAYGWILEGSTLHFIEIKEKDIMRSFSCRNHNCCLEIDDAEQYKKSPKPGQRACILNIYYVNPFASLAEKS